MIEVTVTFRANLAALKKHGIQNAPVRLYESRRFFVDLESMADLVFICQQRGWELEHSAVFTSSVSRIEDYVTSCEWTEVQ